MLDAVHSRLQRSRQLAEPPLRGHGLRHPERSPDEPRPWRCAPGGFARGIRLFLRASAVAQRGLPPAVAGDRGSRGADAPGPRRDLRADRRQLHAGPRNPAARPMAVAPAGMDLGGRHRRACAEDGVFRHHAGVARPAMYLGLGWLGLISTVAIALRSGVRFILPLVWGALAYTGGAVVDFLDRPVLVAGVVGPHELFHLAVLAGISFHWAFIRGIADKVYLIGGGSETATGKPLFGCSPEAVK